MTTAPVDATERPPLNTRKIATLTGWLMVVTFVTSIPAYFIFYAPVRDNPGSITGAGANPTASVAFGALLELILIIANVGTAVVPDAVSAGSATCAVIPARANFFRDIAPPGAALQRNAILSRPANRCSQPRSRS